MTDTKRLRELASRATFESSIWESEDDAPQLWIDNRENNAAWCRAANPQAIIALLDELEKAERENSRLTRGLVQIQHILRSRHLSDGEMCLAALSEATSTIIKLDEKIEGDA